MNNFSSLFEFLAALNSAYVVSDHFINSLVTKINNYFTKLQAELKAIRQIQDNNEGQLKDETKNCDPSISTSTINELVEQNNLLKSKVEALDLKICESIERNAISFNFNCLCLFGALYSIFILVLIGFEFDFKTQINRNSFFLFNILSILALLIIFSEKKFGFLRKFNPSYKGVLIIFCISFLISLISYFIFYRKCDYDFDYSLANTIISLLIPGSHFLYYFFISIIKTKSEANKIKGIADGLKGECEDYAKELKAKFDTIKKVQIDIFKNSNGG